MFECTGFSQIISETNGETFLGENEILLQLHIKYTCKSICHTVYQLACLSICLSVHLFSVSLSACSFVLPIVLLSNPLFVSQSVCLSVCLSMYDCQSVHQSVCTSACLSISPSIHQSVCPSICLSVHV